MRSKHFVIWIMLLLVAQACAPAKETAISPAQSQAPSQSSATETGLPRAVEPSQTNSSPQTTTETAPPHTLEPTAAGLSQPTQTLTLPQAAEPTQQALAITPRVSTAIPGPTLGVLPPPPATVTPFTGVNNLPKGSITMRDNGGRFRMKVGESFLLELGDDTYDWTVSIGDENVLRMRMGVTMVKGAQGIFDALASGTTSFAASGDPRCRQSTPPCMMPSILFEITIIVE